MTTLSAPPLVYELTPRSELGIHPKHMQRLLEANGQLQVSLDGESGRANEPGGFGTRFPLLKHLCESGGGEEDIRISSSLVLRVFRILLWYLRQMDGG